jgi:hypothetical protein
VSSSPGPPSSAAPGSGSDRSAGLSVVLGRADDQRAEVYVRLAEAADGPSHSAVRLTGTLAGPHCRRVTTLPSSMRLADLGPAADGGRVAVARTIVTEPSYWTPDLPSLYRLELHVWCGDRPIRSLDRSIGIRRLGVRGRSFWLDGRRWVPRGTACDAAAFVGAAAHEAGVAAVVADPTVETCEEADREGVAVIALLGDGGDARSGVERSIDSITAWSLHPSVVLVVVPRQWPMERAAAVAAEGRRRKGTMLLGVEADGERPPPDQWAPDFDCIVVRLGRGRLPHPLWRSGSPSLPLVAWRADGLAGPIDRRGCDRLQADLAAWATGDGAREPIADWAGYVVS